MTEGGRYWLARVPGIDRYPQARHLRELDDMTYELVELTTRGAALRRPRSGQSELYGCPQPQPCRRNRQS